MEPTEWDGVLHERRILISGLHATGRTRLARHLVERNAGRFNAVYGVASHPYTLNELADFIPVSHVRLYEDAGALFEEAEAGDLIVFDELSRRRPPHTDAQLILVAQISDLRPSERATFDVCLTARERNLGAVRLLRDEFAPHTAPAELRDLLDLPPYTFLALRAHELRLLTA